MLTALPLGRFNGLHPPPYGTGMSNAPSTEIVDPSSVPSFRLADGGSIPAIGLGTFGSDHATADAVATAVIEAGRMGYRHFDCAAVYANEPEIGRALAQLMAAGIEREQLWITSKLWNDKHDKTDVASACERSLKDLRLDYLDLYLIHWPFRNYHPPGCDGTSRSKDSTPYLHGRYMETWRELERLHQRGLVRHIGTSNMTIPKLELLLRDATIPPAVNQLELHPHFQQAELFEFLVAHRILPIGYSPLGSPGRPDRDRTPEDTVALEDPAIVAIAENHGVHPAAVCLKWGVQRGNAVIPFSTKARNLLSNLQAVISDPLTSDEMQVIAAIDKNVRLIKGQVFLWREEQSWEDLWDLDGSIAK
jgi:alcohol dehydrogenase (NADP+)